MRPTSNSTRILAWLLALAVGTIVLAVPASYAYLAYRHSAGSLEGKVEVVAHAITQNIVSRNPGYWEFEKVRIGEYFSRLMSADATENGRILNLDNEVVAERVGPLAPPIITRTHALIDAGVVVGQVEISRSLRPLLLEAGLIGLAALPVGISVFAVLWFLPIRRLYRTEEQLRKQQGITAQIIETIPMRVFWKDRELRYLGCNTAFASDAGRKLPAELLGKDDFTMGWRDQAELYRADDRTVMTTGTSKISFDEPQTTPDGATVWLRTSKVPLRNEAGEVFGVLGAYEDITQWKNAELALRESEERFRQAFQHSAIGMALVGLDGRWLKVNDALCQIVGFSETELLSMTFQDITHPDDLQTDLDLVRRLTDGEIGSYRMEKRYVHKDGRIVWIFLSVSLVRDSQGNSVHFVSQIEDITARKRAAQALEESELRFRTILDAAVDGILVADARTHSFVTANRGICDMLGYTREEIYALGVEDIHPADALPEVRRQFERQTKGELRVAHDLPVKRKDGTVILADVSSSPMVLAGQPYLVGVFHDVTERKRVEEEVRTYADELTRTNSELQALNARLEQAQNQLLQSEKMASIGMLAAGVAHEINNPVGFIKSNMQSLEKYVDDLMRVVNAYEKVESLLPEHQRSFSEVHRMEKEIEFDYEKKDVLVLLSESRQGLERVTKIVQDLKDFSHVESQNNWTMDNLHKGLDSTLNVVWNELKYTCEVKKEYGQLPPVECVLSQLNQVFMNLLVNAAQAIETKGIITIRTGTEGDMVWIDIADTGKGIAPENIDHVFDPFFTTKPVGKGTGLGLSVSYSIVQKHQGRIAVESEVGKGTTFRVWLPIRQTPDDDS